MKICVGIPAFNGEENIASIIVKLGKKIEYKVMGIREGLRSMLEERC